MNPKVDKDDLFLFVDVSRCVGCYTCEVACEQEYGTKRIKVVDVGPVNKEDGSTAMESIVFTTDACDLCSHNEIREAPTACVKACPTGALSVKKTEEAVAALKVKNLQICNYKK